MVGSLYLIVLWRLKFDLVLFTVSVWDTIDVGFIDTGCVREELFFLHLGGDGGFEADTHDSETRGLDVVLDDFNWLSKLDLDT